MQTNRSITIITPCWKPDNLKNIIECLDNQTYQEFHHIIVNDNNREARMIIPKLCDNKKRFWIDSYIRCHYYGGVARNMGVMAAFTYWPERERNVGNEWILFLDTDNWWSPMHLEEMIKASLSIKNCSLVFCDAMWVGNNNKKWKEVHPFKAKHGGVDLGQGMYNIELFKKYGYFNPRPRRKHKYDWELLQKMIEGEGGKIAFTHKTSFIMSYRKK